jgi:hypothetical protein
VGENLAMNEGVVPARWPRTLSYAVAAVIAAISVAGGVLLAADGSAVYGNQWFLWGLFVVTGIAYLASGIAPWTTSATSPAGSTRRCSPTKGSQPPSRRRHARRRCPRT